MPRYARQFKQFILQLVLVQELLYFGYASCIRLGHVLTAVEFIFFVYSSLNWYSFLDLRTTP